MADAYLSDPRRYAMIAPRSPVTSAAATPPADPSTWLWICRVNRARSGGSAAPAPGTRELVMDYKTWLPQADNRHQLGAWIRYYLFFKKDHPLGRLSDA